MKLVLSPAMKVRPFSYTHTKPSPPRFKKKSEKVLMALRNTPAFTLEHILKTTPEIAMKSYLSHLSLDLGAKGAPAVCAFEGLVFRYLEASDFTKEECLFAEKNLRIFDSVYGSLRANDGILPHRLDMGAPLKVEGKSLYEFWGDTFYQDVFAKGEPVLGLCSGEYAKNILPYLKKKDIFVQCRFLSWSRGKRKITVAHTKMARGAMARFIIKNRVDNLWDVRKFDSLGYEFCEALSEKKTLTFLQGV